MNDEQDGGIHDCRPRFTEESVENNSREREMNPDEEEFSAELQRLQELPIQPGRVSMPMLEEFWHFP